MTVGEPPPTDPGGGPNKASMQSQINQTKEVSAKPAVTPRGVGDSVQAPKQMRSFHQILAEEKENRNILEIKLTKLNVESDGVMGRAKNITFEDVSVLIFDVIGVKPEDCKGVALVTARYDTREVKLKPGIDASKYVTKENITFKDHLVEVRTQTASVTRVTFKNVPFNIPDEEIINLCECYGEPIDNLVQYDRPSNISRGVAGSTRFVDMKLIPGKQFENFYWMEGPMPNDRGCRITVLHNGQLQQCSHCLRRKDSCPGGGVGKLCEKKGTPKGLISDYMKHLKLHHNYTSLKMKYLQEEYPLLSHPKQLHDGFGHMLEAEDPEHADTTVEVVESESKDRRIADLEAQISDQNVLKQQLTETRARLDLLSRSKTCDIPQDFFEYDAENDVVTAKNEAEFDKFIDQKCRAKVDREIRKTEMKNKLLEQVKISERRKRGLSVGSIDSYMSSRRRPRSEGSESGLDPKQSKHSPSPVQS